VAEPHLKRLRALCLALPEAEERETWEEATFRVRDKIFAMHIADDGDGRPALWCKAPPGSQTHLVEADPERFFVPPYVGHKGWIGMWLDRRVEWREVKVVVERSYRMTAPKRLVAAFAGAEKETPRQKSLRRGVVPYRGVARGPDRGR
jgi:hypothetical protein